MQQHGYGGVDQVTYEDVPMPKAGPGEVLVKVIATSVNPTDWKTRKGETKDRNPILPDIPGRAVAGDIVEIGPNVSNFARGQKITGLVRHSYAEFWPPRPMRLR